MNKKAIPVELLVSVQKELLDEILDDLSELRGERSWWKDEPRRNYQKEYNELSERIEKLRKILSR